MDIRWYQILALLFFCTMGVFFFEIPMGPLDVVVTVLVSYFSQFVVSKIKKTEFSFLSPTITALSILLLVRANSLWVLALAAGLAIFSKWIFQYKGKHFFNPSNFSISILLYFQYLWIQPAQWGLFLSFVFLVSVLGFLITKQARRLDLSLAFLFFYGLFLLTRSLYLGDPLDIVMHHLQSGSLYIFAFYMISDPKPTPNHIKGRLLFSFVTAAFAFYFKFFQYSPNAIFYALFLTSILTPFIDVLFKFKPFQWGKYSTSPMETA